MEALPSSLMYPRKFPLFIKTTSLPFTTNYSPNQLSSAAGRLLTQCSTPSMQSPTPPDPVQPSLLAIIFNKLDNFINTFIDPPIQPSLDPRLVLSGNFAPVDELPPTECQVIFGALPSCLDGAYMRVGPNPQFIPHGPYHLFDGDGMVHCVRISGGGTRVTLSSRYIQTYKFKIERQVGGPVIPNFFSGFNSLIAILARGALAVARVATGQYNPVNGVGPANTSLAQIGGRLYALYEADLPYEIQVTPDGDVLTLARDDFNGELSTSMTAHPKLDPETGEVFAFRYAPFRPPFLTFFRFNKLGKKSVDVPIFSTKHPTFLHDFSITKKYAIFPGTQLGMYPAKMVFRGGSPVSVDLGKVPRIGVIPRHAEDEREMRWFDVPGFNVVHAINAWDEVDEHGNEFVTLIAPNILSVEHVLQRMDLIHASVEKVKIDLSSGMVSRTTLSASNLDFGVLNPAYIGKKNRFIYAAVGDPTPNIIGVVKLDLEIKGKGDNVVAKRMFGDDCFGGEPFFIAREPGNNEGREDDGYLVSYVHNEKTGESCLEIMDAKSENLDVVAKVVLPQRVPYGFHGLFVKEKDIVGLHKN